MYDVIIIGGSFAGLAAATQLGRARRKVLVVDSGLPRNRYSPAAHGFLTRDGARPADLLNEARGQLATYKTVEQLSGLVVAAARSDDGFEVELEGGGRLGAHKLILAHGIVDDLSLLPGMEACWGRSVLHCPYCHGYEVADRRLGLLLRIGDALELSRFFQEWTGDLTLFTNGAAVDEQVRETLKGMNVRVVDDTILNLEHEDGQLRAVATAGSSVPLDALFFHPPTRFSTNLGVKLGCETKDGAMGPFFAVDHLQQTSVPGVFAAGDIARPAPNISFAVADGAGAGVFAHKSLLEVDSPQVPGR